MLECLRYRESLALRRAGNKTLRAFVGQLFHGNSLTSPS